MWAETRHRVSEGALRAEPPPQGNSCSWAGPEGTACLPGGRPGPARGSQEPVGGAGRAVLAPRVLAQPGSGCQSLLSHVPLLLNPRPRPRRKSREGSGTLQLMTRVGVRRRGQLLPALLEPGGPAGEEQVPQEAGWCFQKGAAGR